MSNPTRNPVAIDTVHAGIAPLWHTYPFQSQPQGAYLWIDPRDRTAGWASNPWLGNAVQMAVWHGIVRRVACSNLLSVSQIRDLSDRLLPMIERVCDGSSVKWDGSNNVGLLDDDAQDALIEIERILEDTEGTEHVWSVGEWIHDDPDDLTATSTDAEIDALGELLTVQAADDGIRLDGDVVEYLIMRRDRLAERAS